MEPKFQTIEGILSQYKIVKEGSSDETVKMGDKITVSIAGVEKETKKPFWENKNFTFVAGTAKMIVGMRLVIGMKLGEIRLIDIPWEEGYPTGKEGFIPKEKNIQFMVELLSIEIMCEDTQKRTIPQIVFYDNRRKFLKMIKDNTMIKNGYILMVGEKKKTLCDSDIEVLPRQQGSFNFLFGINRNDLIGTINIETLETSIYYPKEEIEKQKFIDKYQINSVFPMKKKSWEERKKGFNYDLSELKRNLFGKNVYILRGINPLSNTEMMNYSHTQDIIKELESSTIILSKELYTLLQECMIYNTGMYDLMAFKKVCQITVEAFFEVFKSIKPFMFEYQVESIFNHFCYMNYGCRHSPYPCIVGSGKNAYKQNLHYSENRERMKDGTMVLMDMGTQLNGFCSDVTRTVPVNGKFSEIQKNAIIAFLKFKIKF